MAAAIRDVAGVDVRCKWPNDLLVGDAKVGGILVESSVVDGRLAHAVVGIGVNLEAAGAASTPRRGSATRIPRRC